MIGRYKYEIIGAVLGLFLVTLLLSLGFWKTLLVMIVVSLGAFLGHLLRDTGILEAWLDKHRHQ